MVCITQIVGKALQSGYLTREAENQLRELLATKYDVQDFNAFMRLQRAAVCGKVRQESRELLFLQQRYSNPKRYGSTKVR